MSIRVTLGALLLGSAVVTSGAVGAAGGNVAVAGFQEPADARLASSLKRLFPAAATFSPKSGAPPHFKAYANDLRISPPGSPELLGFAFWTTELEPLERAYDGPIKILVGLDLHGMLTGIVVTTHREPYGYFSIDTPEFAAQFAGKPIGDAFKVGADIDAVSRASISVSSASRAVRNSARRIARELLPAAGTAPQ